MRSLGLSQFRREDVDVKLTEEGNAGGALTQIRRGRRCFGTLDHSMGFVEKGGRGVGELRWRARPRNEREWRRASAAFDQKEKGNGGGGGSGAGGATRRKEEGGSGRARRGGKENGARRPAAVQERRRWAVSGAVRKQGSGRRAWAARECVGRSGEGMSWAGPERTVPFCN
jgi:hypothetical protein